MKALFSFALVCALFSMSSFTTIKPPAKKAIKVVKTVPSWPITGSHAGYSYEIYGSSSTTPTYVIFPGVSGRFYFTQESSGIWTAGIPSGTAPSPTITAVQIGIYTNQGGYQLIFHPDF